MMECKLFICATDKARSFCLELTNIVSYTQSLATSFLHVMLYSVIV